MERDLAMLKWPIAIVVMDCIPLTSYDYEGKTGVQELLLITNEATKPWQGK